MKNKWQEMAAYSGLRVFPLRIDFVGGKWHKRPLIKDWQNRANFYGRTKFEWGNANGFGILMGYGYYGLDIDTYKGDEAAEAWFDAHGVPRKTRTHRTVSGGLHRIYTVPTDLPTRANIVPGLDGRGIGGFLAFGEGYELEGTLDTASLPRDARKNIAEGSREVIRLEDVSAYVDGWTPPEPNNAEARLRHVLNFGSRLLQHRWNGVTDGLRDTSKSAMDHSVAKLLAMAGLDEDMIVWALLMHFDHGAARWKANPKVAVRAAARSALKGQQQVDAERRAITAFAPREMTEAEEAAMNAALRNGGS